MITKHPQEFLQLLVSVRSRSPVGRNGDDIWLFDQVQSPLRREALGIPAFLEKRPVYQQFVCAFVEIQP